MNKAPRILIIAGPNGAGKTTFAREFLPQEADCPIFVNADLIAAGLANFSALYAPLANAWALYDNSGRRPVLLDWSEQP